MVYIIFIGQGCGYRAVMSIYSFGAREFLIRMYVPWQISERACCMEVVSICRFRVIEWLFAFFLPRLAGRIEKERAGGFYLS